MKCDSPIRIRNKYTGKWLYVACGKCEMCRMQKAVAKASALKNYMQLFKVCYLVTLTYDNNHVPFVLHGADCIYRLDGSLMPTILEVLLEWTDCSDDIKLKNFPASDAVGVLYYRDVQLFLKRLRKYLISSYGYKGNFKYFACGEYGTDRRRPHYHIIFGFEDFADVERFRMSIVENWKMCDWSKLDLSEQVKYANSGCSSYVASYVTGSIDYNGILQRKEFKPFTRRSKDLNFGFDKEDGEKITEFISRRVDDEVSRFGKRYFTKTNRGNINLPSFVISAKFLYTYFSKPCGFDDIPYYDKCRRVREVLYTFITRKKIIREFGFYVELSSSDYLLFLSYKRFCDYYKLNMFAYGTIDYYSIIFMEVHDYYKSLLLRQQMMSYECKSKLNYHISLYNTDCEDLDKKAIRFAFRTGVHGMDAYRYSQQVHDKTELTDMRITRQKYNKFVLPKHINDIYGK